MLPRVNAKSNSEAQHHLFAGQEELAFTRVNTATILHFPSSRIKSIATEKPNTSPYSIRDAAANSRGIAGHDTTEPLHLLIRVYIIGRIVTQRAAIAAQMSEWFAAKGVQTASRAAVRVAGCGSYVCLGE